MVKITLLLVINLSTILGICQSPYTIDSASIKVPKIFQQNESWCYAAATEIILKFHGGTPATLSQCQIVALLSDTTNCCEFIDCPSNTNNNAKKATSKCNKALIDNEKWVKFFISKGLAKTMILPLEVNILKEAIKNKKPIIGLFSQTRTTTHALVIAGYVVSKRKRSYFFWWKDSELLLYLIDPSTQCNGCDLVMVWDINTNSIISQYSSNSQYGIGTIGKPINIIIPK